MKPNMGSLQKKIRIGLGAAFLVASFMIHNVILAILGGILLISGIVGYCPLCCIGKGSCSTGEKKDEHKHGDGGCCGMKS